MRVKLGTSSPQPRNFRNLADFSIGKLLGESSLSTVVCARCRTSGLDVAIKTYHKDRIGPLQLRQVAREIAIHMALDQPAIIPLYAAFEDAEGIHLIMQLATQGVTCY